MRLWSLHPTYLDAKGLVAVWREGLLAQAVLLGRTKGYTRHPQLERFRATQTPALSIGSYLFCIADEATRRGYRFDAGRIVKHGDCATIAVTRGQVAHEWQHLMAKLEQRAPESHAMHAATQRPRCHPIFRIVAGEVEGWEKV